MGYRLFWAWNTRPTPDGAGIKSRDKLEAWMIKSAHAVEEDGGADLTFINVSSRPIHSRPASCGSSRHKDRETKPTHCHPRRSHSGWTWRWTWSADTSTQTYISPASKYLPRGLTFVVAELLWFQFYSKIANPAFPHYLIQDIFTCYILHNQCQDCFWHKPRHWCSILAFMLSVPKVRTPETYSLFSYTSWCLLGKKTPL